MGMEERRHIKTINSHVDRDKVAQWLRDNLMSWTEDGVQTLVVDYVCRCQMQHKASRAHTDRRFHALCIDIKAMDHFFNVNFTS